MSLSQISIMDSKKYGIESPLYYLIDFNSDIATTLQTMGGDTLLATYAISIRAENTLIQGENLAPRPPMPLFPDMPTH